MDKTSEKERMNEMVEAIMKVARGDYSVQVELSGKNDEIDSLAMGLNMMIDDVRKVEESLRESKERFRIASQIASDVVYERDLQTGIATFYGDIESHLGYEPGGYPRTMEGWREHVHPEDLARIESQPMDQIQPGVPYSVEYRMRKKDGTYMTWSDRIVMVWDEKAGKPLKFIGTATNITERKLAEEALQESEQKFKSLAEQSPSMIFINKKGRVVYASKKCEEIMGYKREEFYSPDFDFLNLIVPEYVDLVKVSFSKHMRGEEVAPYECTLITKEGKRIDVIETTKSITYEGENAILGVITDITERKQAEYDLRSLLERESKAAREWQETFDAVTDIVALISPNHEILRVNRAGYEVIGKKPEELTGKKCYEVIHGLNAPIDGCPCTETLLTKKALSGEIHEQGRHYIASAWPIFDENGEILAFTHIVKDITERKRMEEELRESEEKFRTFMETASDLMNITDKDGKFTYVNDSMARTLGYSKEELIEMHITQLLSKESLEKDFKPNWGKFLTNGEISLETTFLTKEGKEIYCELKAVTVYDSDGNFVGTRAVHRDVTERKRMEEELRGAQEKLIRSEKLAAIGQLAGGVGHELRNPLAAIKNAAYYIKGKVAKNELGQKEPRVMEFLDIMEDEIDNSNEIINDLLGFSRIGKPSVSPTQIKKVIENALSRTPISENIELTKKLDTNLPEVEIDPDQINHVFANMITNAVQAMPEGGKLTVSAREKGRFLEVEVSDTGCGIPEESVNKIFDPLFTTKAKGIGLGLAVCKAIIDRHEGNIEVKNKVGKGTTFNVKLPLKREQKNNIGGK